MVVASFQDLIADSLQLHKLKTQFSKSQLRKYKFFGQKSIISSLEITYARYVWVQKFMFVVAEKFVANHFSTYVLMKS